MLRAAVEILTALDQGIPIVGVSLATGKHAYDFDAASRFLTSLERLLEEVNPGAGAVLIGNDVDVDDLSWKLSSTLPSIISIGFNPSASKNVLAGTVTDHHERSERETTTALNDLGDSVDVDDAGLAEAFATIARVVAFVASVESHQNFSPPSRAASASAATRPW